MKILVVNGHPDSKSYVSALFKKYVDNLDKKKHEIRTLDLGKMKFDPVLRFGYREFMKPDKEIEYSQECVKWADHIIFFYPIWWETVPSLLKGWFERVLTPGVAFNVDGYRSIKHLKGKTVYLVYTSLGPVFYQIFMGNLEIKVMKRILNYSGLKIIKIDRIGNTVGKYASPKKREKFLQKIGDRAKKI